MGHTGRSDGKKREELAVNEFYRVCREELDKPLGLMCDEPRT